MTTLAGQKMWAIIGEMWDNFKTRNGSSNYALIAKDGIHLNASGTAVLAKNLDINIQFKKDNSKKKQAVNNNAT